MCIRDRVILSKSVHISVHLEEVKKENMWLEKDRTRYGNPYLWHTWLGMEIIQPGRKRIIMTVTNKKPHKCNKLRSMDTHIYENDLLVFLWYGPHKFPEVLESYSTFNNFWPRFCNKKISYKFLSISDVC